MKKFIVFISILVLSALLISCGESEGNNSFESTENKTTSDVKDNKLYKNILEQILEYKTEIILDGVSHEDASDTFLIVLKEHPEIFWVDPSHSIEYSDTSVKIRLLVSGKENEIKSQKEKFDKKVSEIISKVPVGDDYTKALYLHNYLIEKVTYSQAALEEMSTSNSQDKYISETTSYGAIINNSAVCSGYSAAYQYLLSQVGIESTTISGISLKNGINHAWNVVKMDGEYYHTDVTWDDPSFDGNVDMGIFYDFFGVTTDEIIKTHSIDSKENAPKCTALKDNYFVREGRYFDTYSFDKVSPIISEGLKNGTISIKFASQREFKKCMEDLFNDGNIFQIDFFKNKIGAKNISHSEQSEMNIVTFIIK